jgi:hypothetical protein
MGGTSLISGKQTTGVNLGALAIDTARTLRGKLELTAAAIESLRADTVSDAEAKARMFDIFREGAVPRQHLPAVASAYFDATDETPDCADRSAWGIYNSFTRVLRDVPLNTRIATTDRLLDYFPALDLAA